MAKAQSALGSYEYASEESIPLPEPVAEPAPALKKYALLRVHSGEGGSKQKQEQDDEENE